MPYFSPSAPKGLVWQLTLGRIGGWSASRIFDGNKEIFYYTVKIRGQNWNQIYFSQACGGDHCPPRQKVVYKWRLKISYWRKCLENISSTLSSVFHQMAKIPSQIYSTTRQLCVKKSLSISKSEKISLPLTSALIKLRITILKIYCNIALNYLKWIHWI